MTKEEARLAIQFYINHQIRRFGFFDLPIDDEVIYSKSEFDVYSFKGLLKIAYDLK